MGDPFLDPNVHVSIGSIDDMLLGVDIRPGIAEVEFLGHECVIPSHTKTTVERHLTINIDYVTKESDEVQTLQVLIDPRTPMHRALVSGELVENLLKFLM